MKPMRRFQTKMPSTHTLTLVRKACSTRARACLERRTPGAGRYLGFIYSPGEMIPPPPLLFFFFSCFFLLSFLVSHMTSTGARVAAAATRLRATARVRARYNAVSAPRVTEMSLYAYSMCASFPPPFPIYSFGYVLAGEN